MAQGIKLHWNNWIPEGLQKEADLLIEKSRKVFSSVGLLSSTAITFDNVVAALASNELEYNTSRSQLVFFQHVSPDKSLRNASMLVDKKLAEFDVEMEMRKDVFDVLLAAEATFGTSLTGEDKRYLERLIKLGKQNGLHLSAEIQDKVKVIKKRISDLSIDFQKNLNEETTVLLFTSQELDGVPEALTKTLEKDDSGMFKVTLKYPHFYPVMKYAKNANTRKALKTAFYSKCLKENTPILEEMIELRHQKAQLLGFPTHAALVLEMRMAKTPEKVEDFLTNLNTRLGPLQEEDLTLFLAYKKDECAKQGIEYDGKIHMWDFRYYMRMAEEVKYAVDHNKLKDYFPLHVVTKGLLEIYQELLNLKFEEVEKADVWQEDVKLYSVCDASSNTLMGYFYLDLFPREGKFGHAACFPLQLGVYKSDGSPHQVAVAALVANLTKPTKDEPSLLKHDEVRVYFHEFGHVMHQICAEAHYARFSGTKVETDFVEAPSQMLENWVWEVESLQRMSAHYRDSSPIPDDLMAALASSRTANAGMFNKRQLLFAAFDQEIHKRSKADTAAIFAELSTRVLGVDAPPGTNMAASFVHMAGGYDSQYYGYLWSEVFSADMFMSRFKKEGILNPETGLDYRQCILKPGGSLDGEMMLENFLGRAPQIQPFLISKGLKE